MRRCVLLAALVLCALPAPALAAPAWVRVQYAGDGPTFGPGGGGGVRSQCRPNRALVGLVVWGRGNSPYVDNVAPMCRMLLPGATGPLPEGPVETGAAVSGGGGATFPISCPEPAVATGVNGSVYNSRITSFVLECAPLGGDGRPTGVTSVVYLSRVYPGTPFGAGVYTWPARGCPGGQLPMGIHGNATYAPTRSGPTCGRVDLTGGNMAPVVSTAAADVVGGEGATLVASGRFSDPDGDALEVALAAGASGTLTDHGDGSWSWSYRPVDDTPPTEVRVVATDDFGLSAADQFSFQAQNVAPVPQPALTPDGAANCRPTLRLAWSDPGSADSHTATVDWGDGGELEAHDGPGPLVLRHTYETAGVYTVYATVRDDDGGSGERALSAEVLHRAAVAQPINADGSSRFKNTSTIAIRAQIARCDGRAIGNVRPRFSLEPVGGPLTPAPANEAYARDRPTAGGTMLFDLGSFDYFFVIDSLRTRLIDLGAAGQRGLTWRVTIRDPQVEAATATFQVVP